MILLLQCLLADEPVMDHLEDVTIMFSDLKGYTEWCSKHEPMEVYRVLNKVSIYTHLTNTSSKTHTHLSQVCMYRHTVGT
jgi:CRISPR/Cas system-associated protein Cas10 (large subunit of type III CRISPR-Cas system)